MGTGFLDWETSPTRTLREEAFSLHNLHHIAMMQETNTQLMSGYSQSLLMLMADSILTNLDTLSRPRAWTTEPIPID